MKLNTAPRVPGRRLRNPLGSLLLGVLVLSYAAAPRAANPPASSSTLLGAGPQETTFLPPDVAFRLAAVPEGPNRVRLSWAIAEGYYLYQSRLKFASATPGVTLAKPELPAGDTKSDEYFGKQVVYHRDLIAHLGFTRSGAASNQLALAVTYQGCATAGLCYPPITKQFTLSMPGSGAAVIGAGASKGTGGKPFVSDQDRLARMIRTGSVAAIVIATSRYS
jgi:thiol:disulfide interchange protein DsbD